MRKAKEIFQNDRRSELRVRLATKKAQTKREPAYAYGIPVELPEREVLFKLIEKVQEL